MRMTRKRRRELERRRKAKESLANIAKKGISLTAAAMLFWNTYLPSTLEAMPVNGQVVAGGAIISQNGLSMNISQLTNKAAINWHSFSIAANEKVNFNQPNANAIMLNRVIGNDPSAIFGQMTANGKIFLVNPNGVLFAPGAQVNVGGLLATTHSISDSDFMAGNYRFVSSNADGKVINQGTIIAENQGMVALLAPEAVNEGVIVAQKGSVILASANQATFDFTGDGKIELVVDNSAVKALAENRGLIEVDGGFVLMTASAGKELVSSVVNQSGVIRATSLDGKTGSVELNAVNGTVNVSGAIDASGAASGNKGGAVDVFGENINLDGSASIDVSGDAGGGNVRIGGDWQGSGDAPNAQNVNIAKGAVINADALTEGDGGIVAVWSDGSTKFDGFISAKGGQLGGDGGKVETSGHYLKIENGLVDASAANGEAGDWLLDPGDITIIAGVDDGSLTNGEYDGQEAESTVQVGNINTALNLGTNVKIQTTTANESSITVNADAHILKTTGDNAMLTLEASKDIIIKGSIKAESVAGSNPNKLDVVLFSDVKGESGGYVLLDTGAVIKTNGGYVSIHGDDKTGGYSANSASDVPGVNIKGTIDTSSSGVGGFISIAGQTDSTSSTASGISIASTGKLISGGGKITLNGYVNHTASNSGSTGVRIEGEVNAGDAGTVNITGENRTTANNGITTAGAGTIKGNTVNLTANKMSLTGSNGSILGQGNDSTLNINTSAADGIISIGGSTGTGLHLANTNVFGPFSHAIIGSASNKGSITVNSGSDNNFASDLTLQAGNVTIGGNITTGSDKKVTVNTSGATSSNSGKITAGVLDLIGAGTDFSFSGANAVGVLTGAVKSVNFNNYGAFDVGIAGANGKGFTIGNSSLSTVLTSTNGSVNVKNDIKSSSATTLTINGATGVTVDDAKIESSSGALAVNLKSTGGDIDLTNSTITTKGGAVTLESTGASKNIELDNSTITTSNGAVTLNAKNAINLTNGSTIASGTGNIAFKSNKLSVMTGTNSVSGSGTLSIDAADSATAIKLGGNEGTDLGLVIDTGAFNSAGTGVFKGGFTEVFVGNENNTGTVTIGTAALNDNLTVKAKNLIEFADNSSLNVTNTNAKKNLTLDADEIKFGSMASLGAGNGNLTLNTNAVTNWDGVTFSSTGGNLYVTPKTENTAIFIGDATGTGLSVSKAALGKISGAGFANTTIGSSSTGKVTVGSFDFGTAGTPTSTNLIITSSSTQGAEINEDAQIEVTGNGYLGFNVASLSQKGGTTSSFKVDNLLLQGNGSGSFKLNNSVGNDIGKVAANVGSLEIINSGNRLTVDKIEYETGKSVTGVKAGEITLVTNRLNVNEQVNAGTGNLTIYSKTLDKDIQIGGTDNGNILYLNSNEIANLLGGTIFLGNENFTGNITITGPTTFDSNVEILTKKLVSGTDVTGGLVTLDGTINIGKTGGKDLTITAYDLDSKDTTAEIYLKNLTLNIESGLGKLLGKIEDTSEDHSGSVTIVTPENLGKSIYIASNNVAGNYTILYKTLNDVLTGFGGYSIGSGEDIFMEAGELKASLKLKADKNIHMNDGGTGNIIITGEELILNAGENINISGEVDVMGGDLILTSKTGDVNIKGEVNVGGKAFKVVGFDEDAGKAIDDAVGAKNLNISGNVNIGGEKLLINVSEGFTLGDSKSIIVSGANSDAKITAATTTLGKQSVINLDSKTGSFTLTTDKLTAYHDAGVAELADNSKIKGEGSLTLQQLSKDLFVVAADTTPGYDGLVITNAQLNGGLFEDNFSSLTLGNAGLNKKVTVDGLTVDNNVTIQTGGGTGGIIEIGSGNLVIDNTISGKDRSLTLIGGTITNNQNLIDAGSTGTINLYTNTLNLSKTATNSAAVIGSGTLGIATYDGDRAIHLGDGTFTGTGLKLTNELFSTVFGDGFNHYSIGNDKQVNMVVSGSSLGKDTTLESKNISFEGATGLGAGKYTGSIDVGSNTLTLKASGSATQKDAAGIITANKLALYGGNFDLTKAVNKIGTLAAKVNQVGIKADTLTIGTVGTTTGPADSYSGIYAAGNNIGTGSTVYIHTTNTAELPTALTVKENITTGDGKDITLISDTMSFDEGVRVKSKDGYLTVHQNSVEASMGIGDGAEGKLQLPEYLFNGNNRVFVDGFEHIYLGHEAGTGTVTLSGELDFADPITIRTGSSGQSGNANNGQVIVKQGTTITSEGDMEFKSWKFTTESGTTIEYGGDFTLSVDDLELAAAESNQGSIYGNGNLYLRTYDEEREIYLNNSYSESYDGLWLKSWYFDGTGTGTGGQGGYYWVFRPGGTIYIGLEESNKTLHQSGTTYFNNEVVILQAANGGGGVSFNGTIDTGGQAFSVESKKVEIKEGTDINAGDGNISFTTDELTIGENSTITSTGELSFGNFTLGEIAFYDGEPPKNPEDGILYLNLSWFTDGTFGTDTTSFDKVIIGGDNTTNVNADGLTFKDGFADSITLQGQGEVSGAGIDMGDNDLNIIGKDITIIDLVSNSGGSVSAEASGNITFADSGSADSRTEISNIGNISADGNVNITNNIDLTISGTVNSTGTATNTDGNVTITNNADLTITGAVTSDKGDITITNEEKLNISGIVKSTEGEVKITSNDDVNISGAVESTSENVNIWSKGGDFIINRQGKVTAGKNIHLTTEKIGNKGGRFLNYNTGASKSVLDAGGRWVVFTYDSLDDRYGNLLVGEDFFRRYGTEYGDTTHLVAGDYGYDGNGIAHKFRPTVIVYGEHEYGQDQLSFFNEAYYDAEGKLVDKSYSVSMAEGSEGHADEGFREYLNSLNEDGRSILRGTNEVSLGDGLKGTATNVNREGTLAYGTNHTDTTLQASYIGSNALNYDVVFELRVTPKEVTVTANNDSKTYDGNSYAGSGTDKGSSGSTGGVWYDGFANGQNSSTAGISGDVVFKADTGYSEGSTDAGTYIININGSDLNSNNYTFKYVDGALTIDKRTITVTANDDERVYGDDNPTLTGSIGNLLTKEAITLGNISTSATNNSNVGDYDITLGNVIFGSGVNPNNYEVIYDNGTLTIKPREIIITVDDAHRIYGEDNSTASISYTTVSTNGNDPSRGLVNGDTLSGYSVDSTAGQFADAGTTHDISIDNAVISNGTNSKTSNYIVSYVDGTLTIDKRTLVISADDKSRVYGEDNSAAGALTYTVGGLGYGKGLVNGDTLGGINNLDLAAYIDNLSNAGKYSNAISIGDAWLSVGNASNYDIDYRPGNFIITPLPTGNTGNTENTGNVGNTGNTGNTGNAGNAGNTGATEAIENAKTNNYGNQQNQNSQNQNTQHNPVQDPHGLDNLTNNFTSGSGSNPDNPTAIPPGTNAPVILGSNGSTSQHNFVSEGSGFALHFSEKRDIGNGYAESGTSGAIPILFAKEGEQKLDGIYVINYNPDKLSVLPSAQGVTIPSLDEVSPEANKEFSITYQSFETGSFEVSYGNGIVSVHPLDDKALETLTSDDKTAHKAILANGILMAIEDIGVVPDQIRAVYIFTEQK